LLVGVSGDADEKLLVEEMRSAPVEVKIDAAAVLRVGVLEVVGKSGDGGEFVSSGGVEISVGSACIDSAMTDAEIGKPRRIVVADGNIAGQSVLPANLDRKIAEERINLLHR
jgi:hypothetical protein